MEHLVIHLAEECRLGGPVHYRWMYFVERMMGFMKQKVRNKARAEGSIAERYIEEEMLNSAHFTLILKLTRFIINWVVTMFQPVNMMK